MDRCMRWNALGAACVPVLAVCAQSARAVDIAPYLEYEVRADEYPLAYYADVNKAANDVLARECAIYGYTGCALKKIWYLNSIYFVDYSYKRSDGTTSSGS